ncbi:EcsC family protein [Brevundimonas sp.]|uniref:EcsC family protein n=1 Tax=Brevundimonas sp. TaxID=1871086 RepID=UPI002D60F14E|nr:EcsC family protein [Brevundimonas sp.]HYD28361.1 EcsC family protein [Brevundimonas sp.]
MARPPETIPEFIPPEEVPGNLVTVADEAAIRAELETWRTRVLKRPGLLDKASRATQDRINRIVPERVHAIVTSGVEAMTRGILTGSEVLKARPPAGGSLAAREAKARAIIRGYRTTAGVEGGVAGAGGILLAAADFPALLAIKVRMLADIVSVYGGDGGWGGGAPAERLFLLHIFHLAFASPHRRPGALRALEDWIAGADRPVTTAGYDWRRFQQEYRDYIDLAKMAQLIPVVGAPIGAVVNWRLVERLGETAMMACRMRWMAESPPPPDSAAS